MIVLLIGLALGALVGLTIPSLPTLVLTRGKAFNRRFPPHPEAIPVDGVLLQRVLTMGRMHQWGIAFGLLPLGFGWLILSYSSAMGLGLGLLLGGGWGSLIRTASLIDGDLSPWPRSMAHQLHGAREQVGVKACCPNPLPQWEVRSVRCGGCRALLLDLPRPDLGRPRADGIIMGSLRVLLSGGHPPLLPTSEQRPLEGSIEEA